MAVIHFPTAYRNPNYGELRTINLYELLDVTQDTLIIKTDDNEILIVEKTLSKPGDTVVLSYGNEIDTKVCQLPCTGCDNAIGVVRATIRKCR